MGCGKRWLLRNMAICGLNLLNFRGVMKTIYLGSWAFCEDLPVPINQHLGKKQVKLPSSYPALPAISKSPSPSHTTSSRSEIKPSSLSTPSGCKITFKGLTWGCKSGVATNPSHWAYDTLPISNFTTSTLQTIATKLRTKIPQAHQDAHWAFSWFGAELLGAALATGLFWLLRRSESLGELGRVGIFQGQIRSYNFTLEVQVDH